MSKVIGYRRVSTILQNTERQLDGVTVDKMFEDKLSGKSREWDAHDLMAESGTPMI